MTEGTKRPRRLTPFERWMVRSNLEHVKTEGLTPILLILRTNGYPEIADAVQREATRK